MNPPGVPVEHNYRCRRIGIQVNSYFNEMSEEHGPARGRAEEGEERRCVGEEEKRNWEEEGRMRGAKR